MVLTIISIIRMVVNGFILLMDVGMSVAMLMDMGMHQIAMSMFVDVYMVMLMGML